MAAIERQETPGRLEELMDHICSYHVLVCVSVYVCISFVSKGGAVEASDEVSYNKNLNIKGT